MSFYEMPKDDIPPSDINFEDFLLVGNNDIDISD
jgi:hypothetical protein